jgi:hypothetical protein
MYCQSCGARIEASRRADKIVVDLSGVSGFAPNWRMIK